VPEEQRTGEVDRIECSYGLHRERLFRAERHLRRDLEYRPPRRGLCQRRADVRGIRFAQILENDGSPDRPMALDEREPRASDFR
jgi:hypothetical protein